MARRFLPLGVAAGMLLVGTCAPPLERTDQLAALVPVASDAVGISRIVADRFVAADGEDLPLRSWLPPGEPRAVILALHGFNDYSNAFDIPAALWVERGIATYAYDQRGFGASRSRALWAGTSQLAADAASASRALRALHPGRPLYLLGESMGGAVAVVAMTGDSAPPPDVDGVILAAPALWGRETMELVPKLALWFSVRLFPEMTLSGRGLQIQASDNLPMLRALGRDPWIIKGSRIDSVYGLVNLMDAALAAAPRYTAPTLLLYGAHDELVPREPLRNFVAHLPPGGADQRRLAYYPGGYHLLLRDLDGRAVAADVAAWVLDRRDPLPSRADGIEIARPWPPRREGAG